MTNGEIIMYQTEDGLAKINFRAIKGTVWLTQGEMAELFDATQAKYEPPPQEHI